MRYLTLREILEMYQRVMHVRAGWALILSPEDEPS